MNLDVTRTATADPCARGGSCANATRERGCKRDSGENDCLHLGSHGEPPVWSGKWCHNRQTEEHKNLATLGVFFCHPYLFGVGSPRGVLWSITPNAFGIRLGFAL